MDGRWMGVPLVAALFVTAGQEPGESGSSEAAGDVHRQLDDLIEKTNALDAFVAEYEIVGSKGTGVLRLQLHDSTDARMEMVNDGQTVQMVLVDGVFAAALPSDEAGKGSKTWSVDAGSIWANWRDQLDDVLNSSWKAVGSSAAWAESRSAGVPFFVLTAVRGRDGGLDFDFQIGFASGRAPRFAWLHWFREHADEIRADGNSLQIERDDTTTTVSAVTGFLTNIRPKGEKEIVEIRLVRLSRDEEVEVESIELPGGDRATNPEFEALMEWLGMSAAADDLLRFVQASVEEERTEWNDETRERLRLALRAYAGRTIERARAEYLAATRKKIDEMAPMLRAWEREKLDSGTDPAVVRTDVRRSVAERRAELVERLDEQRDATLRRLLHEDRSSGEELRAAILEVEREAGLGAWQDVASEPILAHFDEQLVEPWAD